MIIDKFIVHMLDINLDKPMLADFIGKNYSDVDKFLKKLINKAKKNKDTVRAKWKNDNFIQNCCSSIFNDENNFTEASKQIAAHYYQLMQNNSQTEPVTLVICQYTEKSGKNIVIMRLENKKTYNTTVDLINEKFNINIIENKKTISTTLEQCVLIPEPDLVELYQLLVLDKESNKKTLWTENFLEAEIIRDDTYKTKVFIDMAQMYIDTNFNQMDKKENAIKILHSMLDTTSNMDIDKFIFLSEIDRAIKISLEKYDIYNSFNIDKNVVEKEFKTRSIKTDTGFVIKNKFYDFEDESKYRIINNPDGTTDLLIKNIQYFKEG